MTKALLICPFCDDSRAFTWQGLGLHVQAKHPNKLSELKDNKEMYMSKFASDEAGNPLAESKGGSPSGDSFPEEPEPEPEPEEEHTKELDEESDEVDDEPEPEPKPKRKSKPKPKRKSKPKPKSEPEPKPEPEPDEPEPESKPKPEEESWFFI